jgi:hypothetical protein
MYILHTFFNRNESGQYTSPNVCKITLFIIFVFPFQNIGFIVTGIGVLFSIVFHLGVPEPRHDMTVDVTPKDRGYGSIKPNDVESTAQSIELSTIQKVRKRTVRQWFTDIKFYQASCEAKVV